MVLLLDLYNGEKISLISFPLSLLKKYTTTYEAQPPSKCTKLEQEALTIHDLVSAVYDSCSEVTEKWPRVNTAGEGAVTGVSLSSSRWLGFNTALGVVSLNIL